MTTFKSLAQEAGTENLLSQEQKEVIKAIEKMTMSLQQKDLTGIMESYEEKAVVVFEPEKPVSDPTLLKEMFQTLFDADPQFEYTDHEVFVNGEFALHFAPWTMTGKAPDGSEIVQTGLSVAVLRKHDDGKWRMIFDNPHGQFLWSKR